MRDQQTPNITISPHTVLSRLCKAGCSAYDGASEPLLRVLILGLNADGDVVHIAPRPEREIEGAQLPVAVDDMFGAEKRLSIVAAVDQAQVHGHARLRLEVHSGTTNGVWVDALFLPRLAQPHRDVVCEIALVAAGADATTTLPEHFRHLERAADDARDGLIITDNDGTIIHASAGATQLFGYPVDELVGKSIDILMPEPYRSRHSQYVASYHQSGQGKILGVGPRELPALHRDKSIFPIELSVSKAEWYGRPVLIGICRDISARMARERELRDTQKALNDHIHRLQAANDELERQREEVQALAGRLKAARDEARAANRAKSDFLATMSHEIRTPLNGISGMVQVLAASPLQREQREHLAIIAESSDTLLGLINELLDLSKIEAGRMTLEARETPLAEFLKPIVEHWRQRAGAKALTFSLDLADDLPQSVTLDPIRLRQVLDNLLGNAVKFTDSGAVRLEIRFEEYHEGGHGLKMRVADTGIGIAAEHLTSIFDSFAQANSTITRRFGGSGLGLAITKRMVNLMDGTIVVESCPGEGTTFTVSLPCQCTAEAFCVEIFGTCHIGCPGARADCTRRGNEVARRRGQCRQSAGHQGHPGGLGPRGHDCCQWPRGHCPAR